MKVLNLHTAPFGLYSGTRPNGGLEKVVIDLHNLLRLFGDECFTVCSNNDYCAVEPLT